MHLVNEYKAFSEDVKTPTTFICRGLCDWQQAGGDVLLVGRPGEVCHQVPGRGAAGEDQDRPHIP